MAATPNWFANSNSHYGVWRRMVDEGYYLSGIGVVSFIDLIAGKQEQNPVEEGKAFNYILHAHGILVPVVVMVLLYTALVNYTPYIWLGAMSVGLWRCLGHCYCP